jgi:MscS family membrane protein
MFCPGADRYRRIALALPVAFALSAALASAQAPASPPAAAPAQATPAPADALGRSTPRGTVLGFLNAARKGENELAGEYLDTASSKPGAEELAHQLFVVLDARLQARLTLISDAPEGSRANPLEPDRELVGTIPTAGGDVQVYVDRVQRGKNPPVWLFSRASLAEIPSVYEEIATTPVNRFLPEFLIDARIGDLRLIDWIVIFLAVPAFFIATAFLNRLLVPLMRPIWRRLSGEEPHASKAALPVPARLLLLALLGRWLLSVLPLSLIVREFWASAAIVITIIAVAWLLVLLNGEIEAFIRRHVLRNKSPETVSLLRVVRRLGDVLVIFGGFLALLWRFGIDATPALAGLGVGGIAVALAAQKTLENVIAGASLIFDQAVRVGDSLKMGETVGTPDRTIVSVPNGQIANVALETLSARDKFWFHPEVRLRYGTPPKQLHDVLDRIRRLLEEQPSIERASARVRFIRLGPFSFDIEVFAYVFATDWEHFLQLQEQLLLGITDAVEAAGASLALPSQTMYVAGDVGAAGSLRAGAL